MIVLVKGSILGIMLFAAVLSEVDPTWATPVNTLLLIILAVVGLIANRKVGRIESKQDEVHATASHAAVAAAAAAEAAQASARITKELGGLRRTITEPSHSATTDPTDTTGGEGSP